MDWLFLEPRYDPYEGDAISFGGKALGVAGDVGIAATPYTGPAAPYVAAVSGAAKLGSLGIDYFYDEPKTRAKIGSLASQGHGTRDSMQPKRSIIKIKRQKKQ